MCSCHSHGNDARATIAVHLCIVNAVVHVRALRFLGDQRISICISTKIHTHTALANKLKHVFVRRQNKLKSIEALALFVSQPSGAHHRGAIYVYRISQSGRSHKRYDSFTLNTLVDRFFVAFADGNALC